MSDIDADVLELNKKNLTLALAESCTGGIISSIITGIPGASGFFLGSAVTYSNQSKTDVLGVDPSVIEEHGAVSHQTAEAMVKGARRLFRSDITLAVTGIAGPTGGTEEKPVGLVYIAIDIMGETKVVRRMFEGSRGDIRSEAARVAVGMILDAMEHCG